MELQTIDQIKRTLVDLSIKFGPKAFTAILIVIIGFFAARFVGGLIQRWIVKLDMEPPLRQLLLRLVRLMVLGLFLILALQNLGVELLPLIAGLSVAGAGVAFAMQGVLGNLVAGLTIIFTRPFKVGDYVAMIGVEGRVEAVDLFTTKLSHPDLSRIVVPNRKIVGEVLHNYGQIRQLNVMVGVAYDTDLNLVLATVSDILKSNACVLNNPAPVVRVAMLADSSINISINPWVPVPDYVSASGEINKAIVEAFRIHGIAIPFPQREVRLLNPGEGGKQGR